MGRGPKTAAIDPETMVNKSHVQGPNVKLPIAELIGNEGPVPSRKVVHISQSSVGDNLFPRFLCCFAPRDTLSGMPANERNPLGDSLKLPAQPVQTRASKAGSRGDKCKECFCLPVL